MRLWLRPQSGNHTIPKLTQSLPWCLFNGPHLKNHNFPYVQLGVLFCVLVLFLFLFCDLFRFVFFVCVCLLLCGFFKLIVCYFLCVNSFSCLCWFCFLLCVVFCVACCRVCFYYLVLCGLFNQCCCLRCVFVVFCVLLFFLLKNVCFYLKNVKVFVLVFFVRVFAVLCCYVMFVVRVLCSAHMLCVVCVVLCLLLVLFL